MSRLVKLAWGVLAYNLLVIAWGAFVRATGSGAGCGRHWPLCNGEVIPRAPRIETVIEMAHRVSSGVALVLVVVLLVATRRALPLGHRARTAAAFSMAFMTSEALVGAGLVLFELVAHDASMKRALSMAIHLGNTFFLLGALALTLRWLTPVRSEDAPVDRRGLLAVVLGAAIASVLAAGASGALAALGDTLFPARSLREGLAQDLSPFAHVLVRLRVLHPVFALAAGLLVIAASTVARVLRPTPRVRALSKIVTALFSLQLGAGVLNVWLLAPVWMQIVHLLLADCAWILLVIMAAEAVGVRVTQHAGPPEPEVSPAV